MEFTERQWNELSEHALQRDLIFLSSPFSNEAALMLKQIGVPAWKIGSGESFSRGLIDMLIEFDAPILLSTGMSSWGEIDQLVELLNSKKTDYILLQCTSKYPTPLNQVGLNVLEEMKQRYNCLTGLSDHTGTLYPAYAAMARGCNVVEVHVAFSKLMFGADITSSITFEELRDLCSYRDALATMNLNPVNKNELALELTNTKKIFTKSVALKQNLKKGAILTEDMLIFKKPGTGIPEVELHLVVGKRLIKDMSPDILLSWEDFE
jgi:N-acetylneuraminate synthase